MILVLSLQLKRPWLKSLNGLYSPCTVFADPSFRTDGLLKLGGEAYIAASGDSQGQVWIIGQDHFGPVEKGFLDWYLSWLDAQHLPISS